MEDLFTAPKPNVSTTPQPLKPPPPSATNSSENHHHLRCPRCDSSNTKFCYYNNYNLTQPRYFCKTCRRYWTKGGALRNVPIGGGCRKNKGTTIAAALANHNSNSSNTSKLKALLSSELGFHQPDPVFWAGLPQPHSSHNNNNNILPLLKFPTQNPNPNFASNPNPGGMYQRLRSFPSNYYHRDETQTQTQTPPVMNVLSSSVIEATAAAPGGENGESGLWNPSFPWSDLLLTNAAYR